MAEKLILTAEALRVVDLDVERPARNIVRTMIKEGLIEVKDIPGWFKKLLRKDSPHLLTQSDYEKKVEQAIKNGLDFDFKKHVAIGTRRFRWHETTSKADGYLEFFYKGEFLKKVSGKNELYWSHPYQREMQEYYDGIDGDTRLEDIERYNSSDIDQEMYEKVMPYIMRALHGHWAKPGAMHTNLVALEESISRELLFVSRQFEETILKKVEFREV